MKGCVQCVRASRTVILVAVVITVSSVSALAQTSDQLSNVKGLVDQARASFEQLDYENTVKALDSAIGAIEARPTPEVRRLMPAAYDMRARALFGLGKENEARADFVSLLKADPCVRAVGPVVAAHHRDVRRAVEDDGHRAAADDYPGRRRSAARRQPRAVLGNDAAGGGRPHTVGVENRLPGHHASIHRGRGCRLRSWTRWRSNVSPRSSGS